ncbi:MAG: uroporphyrinogen decarboxylase family protein [Armatimonadota bacterium]
MISRERFEAVCGHARPDRFPIDYLAHPKADAALKAYYGLTTEEELLDKLECDFYYLSCRDISQNESCLPIYRGPKLAFTETERTCPFGIRWRRGAFAAKFSADEAIEGPFDISTTSREILSYNWPKPEWFDIEPLLAEAEKQKGRLVIGGFWSGIFGDSYRMMGFENFLLNMAINPDMINTLVGRMTDFCLALNDRLFSAMKGKMDIFFFGNDFGTQNGLLFSKPMWEECFFDNIRQLTDQAKSYDLRVMMHSCGGISEIIPYLIEAGVDILDPVQVTAGGMEPGRLAEDFGGEIVFHGGVDTQQVLPYGTAEEVASHAKEVMRTLGSKGGYIFAPSQILGTDIPVENIVAMYDIGRRMI